MSRSYLLIYLFVCLLIALATWMLSYSLILQIVWKDGRILRLMTTTDPFAPFRQFLIYADNRSLQHVGLAAVLPAIVVAAAAAVFGMRRPTNPLGDAAFQDTVSLRRAGWFRRDGHIFGRLRGRILRRKDDRHHLVIGPTRSGKGVGYVIPNALMFKGSMIVTDLKGEIFERTAAYRKAAGNQVFLFSPGSSRTHRWNPLDFVRSDRGDRTIDIQNMAAILIPEAAGSDNAIWQGLAQQVIAGVISYVLESRTFHNRRNLGEVSAFFNAGEDLQLLMKSITEREQDLSRFTLDSFNAYIALNERAARSALLDIQKALAPFRNERVLAATAVTNIDIASLQRRPVTIYLAPSITDMSILRSLLTLFVQQLMDLVTRDHDPHALPVYFLLDEFRQLKRMDEVLNKLPYVAGYNIKMAFIVQDLKSIDNIYGETARHSLLGNCGLQLILGANDQATAEYASRSLGKRTIRYQSETRTIGVFGLPHRTKVEQIRERDLMMPQEVRQMPEDRAILLVEGQKPIFLRKLRYHAVEPFKSAAAQRLQTQVEIPHVELPDVPVLLVTQAQLEDEAADREHELPSPIWEAAPAPSATTRSLNDERHVLPHGAIEVSADPAAEARLSETAFRLETAVAKALLDTALTTAQRASIHDVVRITVPDADDADLDAIDDTAI